MDTAGPGPRLALAPGRHLLAPSAQPGPGERLSTPRSTSLTPSFRPVGNAGSNEVGRAEVTGPRLCRNREETRSPQRGCKMHGNRASGWSRLCACLARPSPPSASATLSGPQFPPLSITKSSQGHTSQTFPCLHTSGKSSAHPQLRASAAWATRLYLVWARRGPLDRGPAGNTDKPL